MRIPKSLKLHLAAGENTASLLLAAIRVVGRRLVATDGIVVASAPVGGRGGVQAEAGEEILDGATIAPRAWAEATRGTKGEGTLRLQFGAQVAQAKPDAPAEMHPPPETAGLEVPAAARALEFAREDAARPDSVQVLIDPSALARLAEAIGSPAGVRLRFVPGGEMILVDPADGGAGQGLILAIRQEGRS